MLRINDLFVSAEKLSALLEQCPTNTSNHRVRSEVEPWHVWGVGGSFYRRSILDGPAGPVLASVEITAYDTLGDDSEDYTRGVISYAELLQPQDEVANFIWETLGCSTMA